MTPAQIAKSHNDIRSYLQEELVDRCRKNPNYSLRAFARAIGIGPAALSDMLNGKRAITFRSIDRIGSALELSNSQIQRFKQQTAQGSPQASLEREAKFKRLAADVFALTSDWYYDAILELMKVQGFEPSSAWVAQSLGLTKSEANVAIERLVRLGLLEIGASGAWRDLSEGFSTSLEPGLTSAAAKSRQQQILKLATDALLNVPIEDRDQTAITMAINPEDLPEARERIKAFRRDLCLFLERKSLPKEVYQLSISLFPVTRLEAKNRPAKDKK